MTFSLKQVGLLVLLYSLAVFLLVLMLVMGPTGESPTRERRVLYSRFVPVDVGAQWERELADLGLSPRHIPLCIAIDHLPDQPGGVVGVWIPCLE